MCLVDYLKVFMFGTAIWKILGDRNLLERNWEVLGAKGLKLTPVNERNRDLTSTIEEIGMQDWL